MLQAVVDVPGGAIAKTKEELLGGTHTHGKLRSQAALEEKLEKKNEVVSSVTR